MRDPSPFLTKEVTLEGILWLAFLLICAIAEWRRLARKPHDPRASREAYRRMNFRIHELAGGRVPRNYRTRR